MGRKKKLGLATADFALEDAVFLRDLLRLINKFQDDVTFFVKYDGLKITEFDPSKVAMAIYWIPKEVFDEYHVYKCGRFMINVPYALKVAFTRVTKDDQVWISVNGRKKTIEFNLHRGWSYESNKKRKLPIFDEEAEMLPTPKVDLRSTYILVAKEFIKDLQDLQKAGFSSVRFISSKDGDLYLEGCGDIAEFTNEYRRGCDILLSYEVLARSKAKYNMSYLLENGFPKELLALSDVVEISWATNKPMRIKMRTDYPVELTHWIAPEIDAE